MKPKRLFFHAPPTPHDLLKTDTPLCATIICAVLAGFSQPAMAAPGDVDLGFNPNAEGEVRGTALQADGKILIAGYLQSVGGVPRNAFARLNVNGTLDTAFNPNANNSVNGIAAQADGKLIIGGQFTTLGVLARKFIGRVNADGTLDAAFNPNPSDSVISTLVQRDGKIVISGVFSTVAGVARANIARLNTNGTLDTSFNPNVNSTVSSMALQADGKIVMGGYFSTVGGVARSRFARLNADGTLDTGFNPNPSANGATTVSSIALQTDGKMLVGGGFTTIGGVARNRIARLNASGTVDMGFNPNANGNVLFTVVQADGKIVIGGRFTSVAGTARNRVARLDNNAATQTLTVPGPSRIQWLRGGSSPETLDVTFELSPDGGTTWTMLGAGIRTTGGWELTDLTLPVSGQVRARARTAGNGESSCSSLMETVTSFSATPQQLWRYSYFGTYENTGAAADNADPDGDGLENLMEFAFVRHPLNANPSALPAWQLSDDDYMLTFTQPAGVSGITYHAESSTSLTPGSWAAIPNSGAAPNYLYYAPAVSRRLYLRLRVSVP